MKNELTAEEHYQRLTEALAIAMAANDMTFASWVATELEMVARKNLSAAVDTAPEAETQ